MKIYDGNGTRIAKRTLDKVRPGEMYGYDKRGLQVWNEDVEDPSGSQSQGPDEQFFEAVRAQVPAETGDDAEQPPKPAQIPVKPAGKGERRLNFSIGHATGEQRCIEAMKAIENEGEGPFTHRLVSQTFENIVALLNEVLPPSACLSALL